MEVTKAMLDATDEKELMPPVIATNLPAETVKPGEIIIEEVTRNHKLLHRHRLNQSDVSIGRGYQNDIILADPHICPQHLSLSFAQGTWRLSDNNSVNGTALENSQGKKITAHHEIINDGDVIIVGKSQLRILFNDHQVAETVAFSPFESLIDFIRHPIAVFISLAVFMLIAGNIAYLNQQTETNVSQLFVSAFTMSLLFALWPAGVALVSHLTKHEPRVLAQFGISFIFFILMWFSDLLEKLISFNSASNATLGLFITLVPIGLAFGLFWLNSYIGFHMTAKRRIMVAVSITTLLFGGSYLLQYSKQSDFNPHPHYNSTLMAPKFLIAPSSNVDDFINASNVLFEQASEAAQQD